MHLKAWPYWVLFVGGLVAGCANPPSYRPTNLDLDALEWRQGASPLERLDQWIRRLAQGPLRGVRSRELYVVDVEFAAENGALRLHSHTSGFEFRDGVELHLVRSGPDLVLRWSTPGRLPLDVATFPGEWQETRRRTFLIEVHNGFADGVRFLVWRDEHDVRASSPIPRDLFNAKTALVDSRNLSWVATQPGRGVYFGVEFQGLRTWRVLRRAPMIDEER